MNRTVTVEPFHLFAMRELKRQANIIESGEFSNEISSFYFTTCWDFIKESFIPKEAIQGIIDNVISSYEVYENHCGNNLAVLFKEVMFNIVSRKSPDMIVKTKPFHVIAMEKMKMQVSIIKNGKSSSDASRLSLETYWKYIKQSFIPENTLQEIIDAIVSSYHTHENHHNNGLADSFIEVMVNITSREPFQKAYPIVDLTVDQYDKYAEEWEKEGWCNYHRYTKTISLIWAMRFTVSKVHFFYVRIDEPIFLEKKKYRMKRSKTEEELQSV